MLPFLLCVTQWAESFPDSHCGHLNSERREFLETSADMNIKVIEYLSKKGYSKTEAMLRVESANQDIESTSLGTKMVGVDGTKYMKGLGK